MRLILAVGIILLALTACTKQPLPVDKPCGVILDSLVDVNGKTNVDQRRIDAHHARGRGAGCW